MTWTTIYMIIMLFINIALVALLCSEMNTRDRLIKLYKEEVEIYQQKIDILEQIKANCEIIETNQEQIIKWRDQSLNSLIIELISVTVAANPDSNGEELDKKLYKLLKNAGITDNWLKENDWFTEDEDDESTDV